MAICRWGYPSHTLPSLGSVLAAASNLVRALPRGVVFGTLGLASYGSCQAVRILGDGTHRVKISGIFRIFHDLGAGENRDFMMDFPKPWGLHDAIGM